MSLVLLIVRLVLRQWIFDKSDICFQDLHLAPDNVCVSLLKGVVKNAAAILLKHKYILWRNGVTSPESLLRAGLSHTSVCQEHHDLKCSQFSRVPTDTVQSYQTVQTG